LEACFRAGVEVVIKSGRREAQVMEDARLIGQTSYIYEMGCGVVVDGERIMLTGDWEPRDGKTIHDLIEESGAPRLLFEHFGDRLEHHSPWHTGREISHLYRGVLDAAEADALLADNGLETLRLVDNGFIHKRPQWDDVPHVFHLIPAGASKANAVAAHMRARGYAPEEVIGVGDSREDADVAKVVGKFFLVANAEDSIPGVERTEGRNGEGFYEAVVRSLQK
jgi:hydroxymethylpyrimidine pyrophosphatase-like HAD family hydrolase